MTVSLPLPFQPLPGKIYLEESIGKVWMTYSGFLMTFLIPPLLALLLLAFIDQRRGKILPPELSAASPAVVVLIFIAVAVIYTTPWDNYLVATHVWWYDPALVIGITVGWVPLEEYAFFILQTALTGMLTITLARYLAMPSDYRGKTDRLRWWAAALAILIWLCAGGALFLRYFPAAYTSLLLLWALPPIALQLAFGAEILWLYRKWTGLSILLPTFYLALADSLAIGLGTWTINPQQSFNLFVGSLPIEEMLFFLCTNTLVVFGIVLAISIPGHARLQSVVNVFRDRRNTAATGNRD